MDTTICEVVAAKRGRPKLYSTPEEKAEADRRKVSKYANEHRDKIKEKNRLYYQKRKRLEAEKQLRAVAG